MNREKAIMMQWAVTLRKALQTEERGFAGAKHKSGIPVTAIPAFSEQFPSQLGINSDTNLIQFRLLVSHCCQSLIFMAPLLSELSLVLRTIHL
jgi:hypothetical protein